MYLGCEWMFIQQFLIQTKGKKCIQNSLKLDNRKLTELLLCSSVLTEYYTLSSLKWLRMICFMV